MIDTARPGPPSGRGASPRDEAGTEIPGDVAAGRASSVVAVIDTVILSGPGRQLVAQAVLQRSRGTAFRIVTFRRAGRPVSPFVAYAEARGVPCDVIEESGSLDMSVLPRVRETLARAGASVVQTHGYRPSAIVRSLRALGWYAGGWVGFYHGATAEDWKVRLYHALDLRLLRSADQVVVMSRPQLALFADVGDRAALVFNAVLEEGAVAGAQDCAPLFPPPTVPRLAAIGRLSPEKGVDILLEAAALLKAEGVPFELFLAGDGPERAALEAQAAALSLGDEVRFLDRFTTWARCIAPSTCS
ncbi:MAG: glycosyltransferase [Gemmatimonadetes bacterium]|nr:glycosyltransferase [Gemmatimonadota bacterium]